MSRLRMHKAMSVTLITALFLLSFSTRAGIAIGLTRAIVAGSDNAGSVQIINQGTRPALIQTWIDNGIADMDQPPESINVPFVIDRPVFRLDEKSERRVRVHYTGRDGALPADRESLFWLNVLDVPPKTAARRTSANEVQIAIHSRIKLFFRPESIPARAENIPQRLVFKRVSENKLHISNPTPWHVTFMKMELTSQQGTTPLTLPPGDMLAPKSTLTVSIPSQYYSLNKAKVRFAIIDDFGSAIEAEKDL